MLCEPTPTRQARPNSERGDSFNSVDDRPLQLRMPIESTAAPAAAPPGNLICWMPCSTCGQLLGGLCAATTGWVGVPPLSAFTRLRAGGVVTFAPPLLDDPTTAATDSTLPPCAAPLPLAEEGVEGASSSYSTLTGSRLARVARRTCTHLSISQCDCVAEGNSCLETLRGAGMLSRGTAHAVRTHAHPPGAAQQRER